MNFSGFEINYFASEPIGNQAIGGGNNFIPCCHNVILQILRGLLQRHIGKAIDFAIYPLNSLLC